MDDKVYTQMLEDAMERTDVSWDKMAHSLHGIKALIIKTELPYADENAQDDI